MVSESAPDGSSRPTARNGPGRLPSGTTMPPISKRTRYRPFTAARFTSPFNRPARVRPIPAKHAVPTSTAAIASRTDRWGRQPRASPMRDKTANCSTSTNATVDALAARRRGRPSGVAPSSLSTPYFRSKPVAMPRPTMAVDITARARMPGATACTRLPSPRSTTFTVEKKINSSTGIPRVSSSCSPLRSNSRVSARTWAR